MNKEEFALQLKESLSSIISNTKSKLQEWLLTDDGLSFQNSMINLGSIVDYGYLGGMIIPYLNSLYDESKRNRLSKHLKDLDEQLSSREHINNEFIRTNLGRQIFEDTIKTIIEKIEEEKIEAQKSFLINSYTTRDPNKELLTSYQDILLTLRGIELRVLKIIFQPDEIVRKIFLNIKGNGGDVTNFGLKDDLANILNIEKELFATIAKRLENENLISTGSKNTLWCAGSYRNHEIEEGINTMTVACGQLLTQFGNNFAKSIIVSK